MRKFLLFAIVAVVVALTATTVYAAPPDEPPGLEKAIAAQEAHNPQFLRMPGVVGTAVGLTRDGNPTIKVFLEKASSIEIPASIDGIPVETQVTGKIFALKPGQGPPSGKKPNKGAPEVTITDPADGYDCGFGTSITFQGTANDKQDGELDTQINWKSSVDGDLGIGSSLIQSGLSIGVHVVTASVTDSDGNTASDSITITVCGIGAAPGTTTEHWPRPVPIGISTGNANECSSGTIGARVRDSEGNLYALSNNHVYARENAAAIGEEVLQPGLYDTGCIYNAGNHLGELSDFVPIKFRFMARNYVDAAIASTYLLDQTAPVSIGGYGVPKTATEDAYIGMVVQKFGRTTLLTSGSVTAVNASILVSYWSGTALFVKQIIVESGTTFIGAGDSGSLLVTNPDCNPVGLLFAGDETGQMAIANDIDRVLKSFGVTIDGS